MTAPAARPRFLGFDPEAELAGIADSLAHGVPVEMRSLPGWSAT